MSSTGNASGSASGSPSGNASGNASGKNKGILSTLTFGLLGSNSNNGKNTTANKPGATVLPVTAQGGMRGGVAPAFYQTPMGMRQPSEAVMRWATTAGAEAPTGPEMRNVAHGGRRRRSHKRKTHHRKSKRSTGGKKRTMRRKTHKRSTRRHHKSRRN
jgi:hypothetical protein